MDRKGGKWGGVVGFYAGRIVHLTRECCIGRGGGGMGGEEAKDAYNNVHIHIASGTAGAYKGLS